MCIRDRCITYIFILLCDKMVFSYVYNLYKAMFNVSNSRPLIPRQQTYVLDRKLVTIHSDDRDIKKWPFSNHFEVELPQIMENVESMRLVECNLPINDEMFKNDYQNTKISFTPVSYTHLTLPTTVFV